VLDKGVMKKRIALFLIAVCIVSVFASVFVFADGSEASEGDSAEIKISTAKMPRVEAKQDIFICFDFYISKACVEYLDKNASDVSIYARLVEYNEGDEEPTADYPDIPKIELAKGETVVVDGTQMYTYTLKTSKITPENADTQIAVRAFIDYTVAGKSYSVASEFKLSKNVYNPYNVVYNAYCNKTYTEDSDENVMKRFLSSKLNLRISSGKVSDVLENKNYKSLYKVEYFDGVLTVYMDGADIPTWMLRSLYINGEQRYFEIHGGKVKLVV
jgi:hypothetical protein